jgi:hypothetical protein
MKNLLVFFMVLCVVLIFSHQESVATPQYEETMVTKKKPIRKKRSTKKKKVIDINKFSLLEHTTKPMSRKFIRLTKAEYAKALQNPKWQKKRLQIFERDNWKCKGCGDTETTLHVHHLTYTKRFPWNEPMPNLLTLCRSCHARAHGNKEVIR